VPCDLSNTCGGRLHIWPVPLPTAKQLLSGRGHPCGNERTKGVNKFKATNVTWKKDYMHNCTFTQRGWPRRTSGCLLSLQRIRAFDFEEEPNKKKVGFQERRINFLTLKRSVKRLLSTKPYIYIFIGNVKGPFRPNPFSYNTNITKIELAPPGFLFQKSNDKSGWSHVHDTLILLLWWSVDILFVSWSMLILLNSSNFAHKQWWMMPWRKVHLRQHLFHFAKSY